MKYLGSKSADAEITLDLVKGTIAFDYSLNKFGRDWSSNSSCTLLAEHNKILKFIDTIVLPFKIWLIIPPGLLTSPTAHKLNIPQHWAQNIATKFMFIIYGKQEQQVIGKQITNELSFLIRLNLWFDYELDGEYKDKIEKIELRRRFVKKIFWYGSCFQQSGWNVIFKFSEPPQNGYVIVRSLL